MFAPRPEQHNGNGVAKKQHKIWLEQGVHPFA
jgi:hypothetical protein